jgi:GMP synthase-like glutamine amidotransferase
VATAVVLTHDDEFHRHLGHLGTWLDRCGFDQVRLYREDQPASFPPADLLVATGSSTSVATGYCQAPAGREIDLVGQWVGQGRPYFGICFGAQVLARATGGSVTRMETTVRGYREFDRGLDAPREVEGRWPLWHEDAITAPTDSSVVARLAHADLMFRRGRAWGSQAHIEFSSASLVQVGRVLAQPEEYWGPIAEAMADDDEGLATRTHALLDRFWSEVNSDSPPG